MPSLKEILQNGLKAAKDIYNAPSKPPLPPKPEPTQLEGSLGDTITKLKKRRKISEDAIKEAGNV